MIEKLCLKSKIMDVQNSINMYNNELVCLIEFQNLLLNINEENLEKILHFIDEHDLRISLVLSLILSIVKIRPWKFCYYEIILKNLIPKVREFFDSQEDLIQKCNNHILFLLTFLENNCIDIETINKHIIQNFGYSKYALFYPEMQDETPEFYKKIFQYVWFSKQVNKIRSIYSIDELKRVRLLGYDDSSELIKLIRNDNIDDFQDYIVQTNLDFNAIMEFSIFEFHTLLISTPDIKIIDYAALCGSVNIFKFLLIQSGIEINETTIDFSIAGGCYEIIHLLESKNVNFDRKKIMKRSILSFQNDLLEFFHNEYQFEYTLQDIYLSIEAWNFEALLKILNEKTIYSKRNDPLFLASSVGPIELVKFFLNVSKFDINDYISDGVIFNVFI